MAKATTIEVMAEFIDSSESSAIVALGDFQGNFVLWVFEREAMR